MVSCRICNGQFDTSPDSVVLCDHKKGAVHLGCCIHDCSMDKQPCKHALGSYERLN